MKQQVVSVYLQDEIPSIGCGWRKLCVKEGRKWVYVRCFNRNQNYRKIKRRVWEKIRTN